MSDMIARANLLVGAYNAGADGDWVQQEADRLLDEINS